MLISPALIMGAIYYYRQNDDFLFRLCIGVLAAMCAAIVIGYWAVVDHFDIDRRCAFPIDVKDQTLRSWSLVMKFFSRATSEKMMFSSLNGTYLQRGMSFPCNSLGPRWTVTVTEQLSGILERKARMSA